MNSNPIRISVVSYLNSIPFVAGLETITDSNIQITLDIPSVCAEKLLDDQPTPGPGYLLAKLIHDRIL